MRLASFIATRRAGDAQSQFDYTKRRPPLLARRRACTVPGVAENQSSSGATVIEMGGTQSSNLASSSGQSRFAPDSPQEGTGFKLLVPRGDELGLSVVRVFGTAGQIN